MVEIEKLAISLSSIFHGVLDHNRCPRITPPLSRSISPQEIILTVLYSLAGVGIAIVNDFKSVEGDRELGMNSLPVAFGIGTLGARVWDLSLLRPQPACAG